MRMTESLKRLLDGAILNLKIAQDLLDTVPVGKIPEDADIVTCIEVIHSLKSLDHIQADEVETALKVLGPVRNAFVMADSRSDQGVEMNYAGPVIMEVLRTAWRQLQVIQRMDAFYRQVEVDLCANPGEGIPGGSSIYEHIRPVR